MANTTFVNQSTVIDASWLNDVNDVSYDVLGDGTNVPSSKAVVRTNLNVPQRNGTDATGTWPIAISGNAATASALTGTLAVANGGTGATTAANARTNLGLVIGTDVLAPNGSGAALTEVGPRLGTSVTASGTAIDFLGVPSWVTRVTLMFSELSSTGTDSYIFQLGSGAIQTTGYLGSGTVGGNGSSPSVATFTGGFLFPSASALNICHGVLRLSRLSSSTHLWVADGVFSITSSPVYGLCGGRVVLAGSLDRIRLTTAPAVNTFDSGTVNISWE